VAGRAQQANSELIHPALNQAASGSFVASGETFELAWLRPRFPCFLRFQGRESIIANSLLLG
jgi:hypothetical protein